jgi:transcription elongation GreA/GreB family factor
MYSHFLWLLKILLCKSGESKIKMRKEDIIQNLTKILEKKIGVLKDSIEELKKSRNAETKSSMGDKYETGRSMVQMEIDQNQQQLDIQNRMLLTIRGIRADKNHVQAESGSLIQTDKAIYFIAIASGPQTFKNETIFCISPSSPIARAMLGKQKGDSFSFGNQEHQILSIS